MLQFKFKVAHTACSVNTAADFLARIHLEVTEKIRLKIPEDIQTTRIEVTSLSDVADEEQMLFTHTNTENDSEEQTFQRNEHIRYDTKGWVANEEPFTVKTSVKEITKIDGNTKWYSMIRIKANRRIGGEQDVYPVLKNAKLSPNLMMKCY